MRITDTARAHPAAATGAVALGVIVLAVALYLFQPWQLFLDTTVSEEFPTVTEAPADGDPQPVAADSPIPDAEMLPDDEMSEQMPPDGPVALVGGSFGDRSHPASGTVTIYELEDGTRTLRIEDLETDNGPDLFVYLSQAGPDAPASEYGVEPVNLGRLKGNLGDQNYEVPADVDLDAYTTVAIWCERFDVVFGTAGLTPA